MTLLVEPIHTEAKARFEVHYSNQLIKLMMWIISMARR